jgi:hypothetical protein
LIAENVCVERVKESGSSDNVFVPGEWRVAGVAELSHHILEKVALETAVGSVGDQTVP